MQLLIKKYREEKGISLRQLQKLTGISRSQLNDIENKKSDTGLENLAKIADHLDVCTKDLFTDCHNLKATCDNNCGNCHCCNKRKVWLRK